jgi:hypothetical protein
MTSQDETDNRSEYQKDRDRKAKEKALLKDFAAQQLGSEDQRELRRARLKTLIKMGKSKGYLTLVEMNDVMSDELSEVDAQETLIGIFNDIGIRVYEDHPTITECIIYLNIENYFGDLLFNLEKNNWWIGEYKKIKILLHKSKFASTLDDVFDDDITYQKKEHTLSMLNRISLAEFRLDFLYLISLEVRDLVCCLPPWIWLKSLGQTHFDTKTLAILKSNQIVNYSDFLSFKDSDLHKFSGIGNKTLLLIKQLVRREIEECIFFLKYLQKHPIELIRYKNSRFAALDQSDKKLQNKSIKINDENGLNLNKISNDSLAPSVQQSLLNELRYQSKFLKPDYVIVLKLRLGLDDKEPHTFDEIGHKLGKTRERIRQIELKVCDILKSKSGIVNEILTRVANIRKGLLVPLTVSSISRYDSWFDGISDQPWVLASLLSINDITQIRIHSFDGDSIISPGEKNLIENLINETLKYCELKIDTGLCLRDVKENISSQICYIAPELVDLIFYEVRKSLIIEQNKPIVQDPIPFDDHFNGYDPYDAKIVRLKGNNVLDSVEQILLSSNRPLKVTEIVSVLKKEYGYTKSRAYVANLCQANFYLYGSSTYGLFKHLGLTQQEVNIINEILFAEMLNQPKKQRHADQLLEILENFDSTIAKKIDNNKLCVCLKNSDKFIDLGRMVFLPNTYENSTNSKRIDFYDSVEQILRKSIAPLTSVEILDIIRKDRDLSENAQILPLGKILLVSPGCWGLYDKHLFLSDDEFQSLVDLIVNLLREKKQPMSGLDIANNLGPSLLKGLHHDPFVLLSIGAKSKLVRKERELIYLREWGKTDYGFVRSSLLKVVETLPPDGYTLAEIVDLVNSLANLNASSNYVRDVIKEFGLIFDTSTSKWKKN